MLRMTAISEFVGAISQTHLISIVLVSIIFATIVTRAERGNIRTLIAVAVSSTAAVIIFSLSFFVFVFRNAVVTPRYDSSDLFLSVLIVCAGTSFWVFAESILRGRVVFHPVMLPLGGAVSLVFSGVFAILLPLAHQVYAWAF